MDEQNAEMLLKKSKKYREKCYLTIQDKGLFGVESVLYRGKSEIQAYKKFKEIVGSSRIIKADVKVMSYKGVEIIETYSLIELVKEKKH